MIRARSPLQRCCITAVTLLLTLQLSACSWPSHASDTVSQQVLLERLEAQPETQSEAQSENQSPQQTSPQDWLLLDVRSPQEYAEGHVPGAVNIDHRELGDRLPEIQAFQTKPVIVYCETGVRATRAERLLTKAGFTQIQQLEGHMSGWRKQNLPTATAQSSSAQSTPMQSAVAQVDQQTWVVNAAKAKQLIEQGATLIDAQGKGRHPRLQSTTVVHWDQFTPDAPTTRGRLLGDDRQLETQLRAIGISNNTPVVVFDNPPQGWGEAGRIVWMLRTLGHTQAVLVDGGVKALKTVGVETKRGKTSQPVAGDFVVTRTDAWNISADALRSQLLSEPFPVLIDTREPREYRGKTPYGEQRGGHVPGAINLYFKALLAADGTLLPDAEIREQLAAIGITPDSNIVAYCTGGIRSGWLTAVLTDLGYSIRNYAGSMWEWSAGPRDRYPLEKI